jgi:hypothetical protein
MLMRERSGLSGRRRGSQKPGTAIGSAVTAAEPGGDKGEEPFVVCACAADAAKTANIAATTHVPPCQHILVFLCELIRRPFTQNPGDHITAAAAGQP